MHDHARLVRDWMLPSCLEPPDNILARAHIGDAPCQDLARAAGRGGGRPLAGEPGPARRSPLFLQTFPRRQCLLVSIRAVRMRRYPSIEVDQKLSLNRRNR